MSRPPDGLDRPVAPADLRDRMTAWRRDHSQATFAEMELEAERQVAVLRAELIAVALAAGEPDTATPCPDCGVPMQRVGTRERTVRIRGDVPVTVTGDGIGARPAGPSLSPLAETLDLRAQTLSPWVAESAALLGALGPFRTAAWLLERFTGVRVGPVTVRRLTLATGATMRDLELDAAAAVLETGKGEPAPRDVPLQPSVDGSRIHIRGEGWREVKLLAIGERSPDRGALTALSYAATLGTAEVFADASLGELGRRGIPQATDLVAVNDGAVWIQEFLVQHCP